MAFTGNYMCTSFKVALLNGEMDFSSDTSQSFKIALYTSSATLNAETTAYSTTNEASGTGYTAGGNTLTIATNPTNDTSGTTAYLDFSDTVPALEKERLNQRRRLLSQNLHPLYLNCSQRLYSH